jgi:hypothetical protein
MITNIEFGLLSVLIVRMSIAGFGGVFLLFLQGTKWVDSKYQDDFNAFIESFFGIVIAALALGESITVFQCIVTRFIILQTSSGQQPPLEEFEFICYFANKL